MKKTKLLSVQRIGSGPDFATEQKTREIDERARTKEKGEEHKITQKVMKKTKSFSF